MRKLFLLFTIAALALSSASCEGPQGPPGPGSTVEIIRFNTAANQWVERGTAPNLFYSVTYSVPELTTGVLEVATIVAYVRTGTVQEILPRVRHLTDGDIFYTSTIDYAVSLGEITFFYTNSDFVYGTDEPGDRQFRLVFEY